MSIKLTIIALTGVSLQRKLRGILLAVVIFSNLIAVAQGRPLLANCIADDEHTAWQCDTVMQPADGGAQPAAFIERDVYNLSLGDIADRLGYRASQQTAGLCQGYFFKEPIPYETADAFGAQGLGDEPINISAGRSSLSLIGGSELDGGISISDRTHWITAYHGYLFRDATTHQPSKIKFSGDIHLRQPNTTVLASSGIILLPSKLWQLKNILYQHSLSMNEDHPDQEQLITGLSAWGRAISAKQIHPHLIDLYQASYTTCPPTSSPWALKAAHIRLNKETGRGYLTNGLLYVKNVPVFYVPYFNFPIDNQRQTGLLPPTYGHSSRSGTEVSTPIYLNVAPNYDATVTPRYLSQRGWLLDNNFRYLFPHSRGTIAFSELTHDKKFSEFKQTAPNEYYPSNPSELPAYNAQVRTLEAASTARSAFAWIDQTQLNEHVSTDVNYRWVSDDYQNQDLTNSVYTQTETQLLQQAILRYEDTYTQANIKLQHYQTLHPINVGTVTNQYSRLPELSLFTQLPQQPYGFVFVNDADFNYFDIANNPGQSYSEPIGLRFNLRSAVSRPIEYENRIIVPRLQLTATTYQLQRIDPLEGDIDNSAYNPHQISRALPVFDIDAKIKFISDNSFFHENYIQTLEPELYYLYVPYVNQNKLPIFDTYDTTQPLAFTYDQLFRYNRFVSADRIGDANQVTLALTTRFLQNSNSAERFRASIGEIFYFQHRNVLLCSDNPAYSGIYQSCSDPDPKAKKLSQQKLSPLAGLLSYYLNNYWSVIGSAAWDPYGKKIDNETLGFHYQDERARIFNVSYSFAYDGDILDGDDQHRDLRQTNLSAAYPLVERWKLLGQWGYNWSHDHIQSYLYGLEYESCCWAMRFVSTRNFIGFNNDIRAQFDRAYYIQFVLKGVSRLGASDPGNKIETTIKGYKDNFGGY